MPEVIHERGSVGRCRCGWDCYIHLKPVVVKDPHAAVMAHIEETKTAST